MPIDIVSSLSASGTRFVRVLWCDNANVIRAKAVHVDAIGRHLKHGVGISAAQQAVPVTYDGVAPGSGLGPVGEVRLVPDWSTLAHLPYAPGHARVLGDMLVDGEPYALCPRAFLRRMVNDAAREGLEVVAAFENEFYLLRETPDGLRPSDATPFASTLGMDAARPVIDDVADALVAQGIPVEQYYSESGPGQHEISTRHCAALTAADRQVAFRETVHAIAARHGLRASFLPKLFADAAGSGCHVHLSLWRDGRNVMPDASGRDRLSATARAFVEGVLARLPALMAVTTPTPNSYRRVRPHTWSGAFRCWGLDNREAAVRVPTGPEGPGPTNVEIKTVDASANPYLALGAIVAAGLDGVRRGLDCGEPIAVDPGTYSDAERLERGVDALPSSLGASLAELERDDLLLGALGPALARAYLAVKAVERDSLSPLSLGEEVALLAERY